MTDSSSSAEGEVDLQPDPISYMKFNIASSTTIDNTSMYTPRTELDHHTKMDVLEKNCFVFDVILGGKCEVEPFDTTIGYTKEVPIVDAAIAYEY